MRWLLVANMSLAILSVSSRRMVKKEWEYIQNSDKNDGTKGLSIWSYLGLGCHMKLLEPIVMYPFGKR